MNKICFGCGAKLQSVDETKEGYVPDGKLESSDYCKRCFRMANYGEKGKSSTPKRIDEILKTVNKNAKHVVFMADFINVFDEVMNIFKKIRVPKTLVISKSDIIPKNVSFAQIRNYLRVVYKVRDDVVFTSNKTSLNTFMKKIHGLEEVYFLGLTNAGKSTLLNSIIEKSGAKSKKLTTSYKENTTQDFIRIKLGDVTLIDSPGFVIDNFELDKFTNVSSEIKPITYQNKVPTMYKIGDVLSLSVDGKTSAVFYFSKSIDIKRFYNKKVVGTTFKVRGNSDVVICGLGFIKFTEDAELTLPQDVMKYTNIRPSLVGGVYE